MERRARGPVSAGLWQHTEALPSDCVPQEEGPGDSPTTEATRNTLVRAAVAEAATSTLSPAGLTEPLAHLVPAQTSAGDPGAGQRTVPVSDMSHLRPVSGHLSASCLGTFSKVCLVHTDVM